MAIVRDITERKRAEEVLRQSEQRYRSLAETAPDVIFTLSTEGTITSLNPVFQTITGWSRAEWLGKSFELIIHPDDLPFVMELFQRALQRETPPMFELRVLSKSGEYLIGEFTSTPQIQDGKVVGVLGLARDITERKRAEEALRREHDLAEALEEATAALTATLDFEQVLDRILEQVSRIVPNDATNIMLIEGGQARVVRWRGYDRFGEKEFVSTVVFRIPEVPGLQQMMESAEPIVIPDTATYPGWVRVPVTEWLRSYAAAPIIVRGEVIGFLNVDSATPGFFTQAHAETLRAFADHAAAAIENARLYEAEQERRHIAETLRQASTVLNSTLELDEVLRLILQQLRQVIPYDSASVQRLQDAALSPSTEFIPGEAEGLRTGLPKGEHLKIVACQGFEEPDKVVGLVFPLDPKFPNYRVVRTKAPLAIQDITQDYRHFKDEADTYESGRIRSWLGVPLMVKDEVIGMIAVDREEVHAYTAEESQLAMAFANQAAIAMENARLHEETQRQSERLAQTLALSELLHGGLELEQVLEQIAQGTVGLGFRRAVINVCQPEEDLVRVRAMAGLEGPEGEALMGATYRWSDFQAIMQEPSRVSRSYLILHGKVDWERDFQGVVVMPSREDRGPGYWHPEDMLLVPLWGTRGEPVGLLSVDEPADGLLPDLVTIQTLEAFANQAAIAIENARLFEETRRRALQLKTVEEVGRRVSSILDLDELFPYVTKAIQRNFGYHHVDIFLVEPATGYAVFKASSDPALEKAWREQGLRFKIGEEGMIGLVAHTGEPLLANDVSQEPHYLPDELLPETKSELVVPLKVEERVVGVLDVDSDQLDAFDEDNLFVLQTLANQIAIAIENARLFEETERLKAFNESIVQGMSEGIVVEDVEGSLTYVNPSTTAMLGYSRKELLGQHWTIIVPPDQQAIVQAADERRKRGEADRYEIQLIRKDGTRVPVLISGSPWFEEGRFAGTLTVFTDITARKRMEEALRAMLLVDELTGLYNRRGFLTLGQQQLKIADRTKRRMFVVFADFDHLKRINDALGHREGDLALIEVANVLKETFRESDIIARIGGDEFVALPIETDSASAEILTTRLQENLGARNAEGGRRYKLSLSVGIARYDPESPCSIDALVAEADRAMYEQKQGEQKS